MALHIFDPDRLPKIKDLCKYVSQVSVRPIRVDKPIVGEGIYMHESGIHVNGLMKDPLTFQPFDPTRYGLGDTQYIFGIHSGPNWIQRQLKQAGIDISLEKAKDLREALFSKARTRGRSFHRDEIVDIYQTMSKTNP